MYLHLGKNTVVKKSDIIGIFDIENSTIAKSTKKFLAKAQKEKRIKNVSMELPKSFVVCMEDNVEMVYISQISPTTLLKRADGFEYGLVYQKREGA